MGMASKPRDEKLKMMKTKQTRKANRKLKKLAKGGKLARHVVDRYHGIKAARSSDSRKRVFNIEEDWTDDRAAHFDTDREDILPLDMLDADIDWENSAFAGVKRRKLETELADEQEASDNLEGQKRRFEGELEEGHMELLPIKLKDGTIVRPTQKKQPTKEEAEEDEEVPLEKKEGYVDPTIGLSAAELVVKRRHMLAEQKTIISGHAFQLLADPQTNVFRLRDMHTLCAGSGVHPLIRESVQKLAVVSMMQVLQDIIPGYAIRQLTEAETQVQLKKETKKLQTFEEALLRYHLKFLQLCEKNIKRLNAKLDDASFTAKIGMISLRALSRLLLSAPHFNYSTNIVSALTRLAVQGHKEATAEVCATFSSLFREDLQLKMSLFAVKAIHDSVKRRIQQVPPALLAAFLSLRINKVQNDDKKSDRGAIMSKKLRLKRERQSKSKRKYDKQLAKLENDLKEVEAAESLSNKLKTATECMKQVFHIYFSILKRMPSLALLDPVLEGLSKFAHMLNVEFFEDMIKCMEELVDQKHLRVIDSLHCVYTVFVILSAEGAALNVDPHRFYQSVYRLISALPFEKDTQLRRRECFMLAKCLDLMLIARRKQVSIARTASFTRRLLLTAIVLDDVSAVPLVATARALFVAHAKLVVLVENGELEEGGGSVMYRPDADDPDSSGAHSSDAFAELNRLAKRRHGAISSFGRNMLHGVPSSGLYRVDPSIVTIKPWKLGEAVAAEEDEKSGGEGPEPGSLSAINAHAKKRKVQVSSKNLYSLILQWIAATS